MAGTRLVSCWPLVARQSLETLASLNVPAPLQSRPTSVNVSTAAHGRQNNTAALGSNPHPVKVNLRNVC